MRVLLWMAGAGVIPGGHRVQLDQTSRHLQALGVQADVSFEERPPLGGYDLIHGFSLGPTEIRLCRNEGLPVALSTIYWSKLYTSGQHKTGKTLDDWKRRARMGLVLMRSAAQGRHIEKCEAFVERIQSMRIAYEMADLLLPYSEMEAKTIQSELGTTTPYHVVPNAVDHHAFRPDLADPSAKRDHVLYAGRAEPHKNQLGLIEAMRNTKTRVVIVGPPHPHHSRYYEQCQRRATGNIEIRPGVPHEELPLLYAGAKAHVLPSWFETTGLVSLEAALCGCNIVTTDRGYAREYFQEMAWYCDPADSRSIRDAVERASEAPVRSELRQRILDHYTWEHTARETLAAYELILSRRPSPSLPV